jgi:sulfur carrier protein ThiS
MTQLTNGTSKHQLLRDLNHETRTVVMALNQAASAISYAQKQIEQNYQRTRQHILAAHVNDEDRI